MSENIKTEEKTTKTIPQKVPRYLQFYKQEWEKLPIFKGWLTSVAGSRHRAYCRYCRKEFRAHRTDLRSHAKSRKHQRASENYVSEDRKPNIFTPQTTSSEKASSNRKKGSPASPEAVPYEGPSDNANDGDMSDSAPPSPASVEAVEILHPKKVRAYMKGKEKQWRISTQVLDLVRGVPVVHLCVSLLHQKENHWKNLNDGYTDSEGQWHHAFSSNIKAGRYKLHFETKKYFTLGLHDTCYPYIEVVFDISENIQQYHVPLLVSPFGYMVYRGGK